MSNKVTKRKVGAHITKAQKIKLLKLMTENTSLRTGKFSKSFTLMDAAQAWGEIASELNGMPGAQKNWKSWRKTWQDIYSKLKAKHACDNKNQRQSELDESVAALVNPRVVSGHESQDSTVTIQLLKPDPDPECDVALHEEPSIVVYQIETDTSGSGETPPKKREQLDEKNDINTLLREKVDIKKKYFEEKLKLMGRKNDILQNIADSFSNICQSLQNYNTRNSNNIVPDQSATV